MKESKGKADPVEAKFVVAKTELDLTFKIGW